MFHVEVQLSTTLPREMEVGPRVFRESYKSEAILRASEYSHVQDTPIRFVVVDCYTLSQFRAFTVAEEHLCFIDGSLPPWSDFDKHAN